MMRYHRMSPDSLPSSNERRSNSKENDGGSGDINSKALPRFRSPSRTQDQNSSFFGGGVAADPSSPRQSENHLYHQHDQASTITRNQNHESNSPNSNGGGGDVHVLLQWGHRKRSRCSRTESRVVGLTADESSSSSSVQCKPRQAVKVQRRLAQPTPAPGVVVVLDKQSTTTTTTTIITKTTTNASTKTMPPPPLPSSTAASNGGGQLLKPGSKDSSGCLPNRKNSEERSAAGSKSPLSSSGGRPAVSSARSKAGKRPPLAEKFNRKPSSNGSVSLRDEKMNGCPFLQEEKAEAPNDMNHHVVSVPLQSEKQVIGSCFNDDNNKATATISIMNGGTGGGEKVNGGGGEMNEWPRIYIPLSRKEKEEDFLAMKGTKLPHRPKKRPKAIDRILQYCFPGMWLSDLTRGRYEVREKKCAKKQKRRGLKGMENIDSDSE